MRRGTTPTHTFKLNTSLAGLEALYVTYQQNGETIVEKALDDDGVSVDEETSTVTVKLTQADTLLFSASQLDKFAGNENRIRIQIRLAFEDGTRLASNIVTTPAEELLKDGEI